MPFNVSRRKVQVRFEQVQPGDRVEHLGQSLDVKTTERDGGFILLKGDAGTFSGAARELIWRVDAT